MLSGIFLSHSMAKAYDDIGELVKRFACRHSLQCPYKDQIISLLDLFRYCTNNFKTNKFFFSSEECVAETQALLFERQASAVRIEGTREYHNFFRLLNLCF